MNADSLYKIRRPYIKYLLKSDDNLYTILGLIETDIIKRVNYDECRQSRWL